jgi:hypothetical protein
MGVMTLPAAKTTTVFFSFGRHPVKQGSKHIKIKEMRIIFFILIYPLPSLYCNRRFSIENLLAFSEPVQGIG